MIFVGRDSVSAGDNTYAPYIRRQLSDDDHFRKISNAMQAGGKGDEMGWKVYETCKDLGASIEHQIVDSAGALPCVDFGALFIVFAINGDPSEAHGYFKNIVGQVIPAMSLRT